MTKNVIYKNYFFYKLWYIMYCITPLPLHPILNISNNMCMEIRQKKIDFFFGGGVVFLHCSSTGCLPERLTWKKRVTINISVWIIRWQIGKEIAPIRGEMWSSYPLHSPPSYICRVTLRMTYCSNFQEKMGKRSNWQ